MPYVRMRIDYFNALDIALKQNNYIKIYLQNGYITVMEMIEKEENEQEVVKFRAMNGRYKNILDLCLALSTQLNEGVNPFPQYKNVKMRNKTLDMVVLKDCQLYFYRLNNDKILGTITKIIDGKTIEVFTSIGDTLKETFELLDSYVYNHFGFYPGVQLERHIKVKSRNF